MGEDLFVIAAGLRGRWRLVALGLVGVFALAWLGYGVWSARLLRPLADDYCWAAAASRGFPAAVADWYGSWSGDLVQVSVNTVLIGLPVLHLPWAVGSGIAFVVAVAAVMLAAFSVLAYGEPLRGSRVWKALALLLPTVALAWWGYWWLPVAWGTDAENVRPLANAITMWQNINTAYVITPLVAVVAWLGLQGWHRSARLPWLLSYGALGVVIGLSGIVFGASVLAFAPALLLLPADQTRTRRNQVVSTLLLMAGSAIGLGISLLSPGADERQLALRQVPGWTERSVGGLLTWTFPASVQDWVEGIASVGAVLALVVGFGIGLLLGGPGSALVPGRLVRSATVLASFSLVASVVTRLGEASSYEAFWHLVMPRTMLFLALVAFGVAAGSALARPGDVLAASVAMLVFGAALLTAASAVGTMTVAMADRQARWEVGPAGVEGIFDIDGPLQSFPRCWTTIIELRDAPPRGDYAAP